jgi:hypothetical protein
MFWLPLLLLWQHHHLAVRDALWQGTPLHFNCSG